MRFGKQTALCSACGEQFPAYEGWSFLNTLQGLVCCETSFLSDWGGTGTFVVLSEVRVVSYWILLDGHIPNRLPWWLRWERIRLQRGRPGVHPWVGKIPWKRAWQPTPVCLPGGSHGQRSLVGYHPRGRKEPEMTEQLNTAHSPSPSVGHMHAHCISHIRVLFTHLLDTQGWTL